MKEKCTKYEALFTFSDEKTLREHVEGCDDCRKEQEIMDKVSELIKEVKPEFLKRRKNTAKLKVACAAFAILLSGVTLGVINLNTDISDTIRYGQVLSIEDYGFPVDSYGLIMVDE